METHNWFPFNNIPTPQLIWLLLQPQGAEHVTASPCFSSHSNHNIACITYTNSVHLEYLKVKGFAAMLPDDRKCARGAQIWLPMFAIKMQF